MRSFSVARATADRCTGSGWLLWPSSAPVASIASDSVASVADSTRWELGAPAGTNEMITDFEVGVLLPSAVESSGTSGFVSG